jgi:enoyl-CoA hydratase/carnithine racemase
MTETAGVRVEDRDGVRWVTLERPESKNSLTLDINERIIGALKDAATNPAVRVVVLTGAGGAFCSGLDLKFAQQLGLDPEGYAKTLRSHFHGLIRSVTACMKPVIAAVDGPAVGYGCDLALACDLRFVSDRARFGELFVKRGLMPDGGGTFTLSRLVGLGRALEMMLTGELIDAVEAHRFGIANRIIPAADLNATTQDFARKLSAGSPLVYASIKQAVYGALHGTFDDALEAELKGQVKLLGSEDFKEGMTAFLEKRTPRFVGR